MASSSTISSSSSTDPIISPSTTRVGWIGTGVMGAAMAGHLLADGYSLSVFNRTASKAQPLVSRGACLSPSPASLAASSDVVFLIVGFPSDVRLLFDGLLPHLSPGSVLVDMTTSDPSLARDIFSAASSAGVHALDAPVSGGDVGARNAPLSIFAGGDEMVVRRLSPLFNLMGKVYYMGGPGLGQYAKLGNQIAIASTLVGLVEGMVYAHKAGLDVERWMEAISKGAAGSRTLELFGKRILERELAMGSHVKHFVKDLGICLKECERMGLALPGLALAQQMYLSLVANGEEELGMQALVLAVERLNNVRLTKKTKEEEEGKSG